MDALDELPEGRVKTVGSGHHRFAVTHHEGAYAALSNRCPHQGGPLGEGSIENGVTAVSQLDGARSRARPPATARP